MTTVVFTYATPGFYAEAAKRMQSQAAAFGVEVVIDVRHAFQHADDTKTAYWRACLEKVYAIHAFVSSSNRPALWVDADSEIRGPVDWSVFPPDIDAAFWTTERGTFGSGCHYWHPRSIDLLDHAVHLANEMVCNAKWGPDERVWAKVRWKYARRCGMVPHGVARVEGYYTQHPDAPILFHRQLTKIVPPYER